MIYLIKLTPIAQYIRLKRNCFHIKFNGFVMRLSVPKTLWFIIQIFLFFFLSVYFSGSPYDIEMYLTMSYTYNSDLDQENYKLCSLLQMPYLISTLKSLYILWINKFIFFIISVSGRKCDLNTRLMSSIDNINIQ